MIIRERDRARGSLPLLVIPPPILGCGTTAACHELVWSPDGKKIAFTMFVPQTGHSDLYMSIPTAPGTGLYQVTHAALGAGLKDWGTHPLTH